MLCYERHPLPKISIPKRDIRDAQRAQDRAIVYGEGHALPDAQPAPASDELLIVDCRIRAGVAALKYGANYAIPRRALDALAGDSSLTIRRVSPFLYRIEARK